MAKIRETFGNTITTKLHFIITQDNDIHVTEYHKTGFQEHKPYASPTFLGTSNFFTRYDAQCTSFMDLGSQYFRSLTFNICTKQPIYTHLRVYEVHIAFSNKNPVGLCGPQWEKLTKDLKIMNGHFIVLHHMMENILMLPHFDASGKEVIPTDEEIRKAIEEDIIIIEDEPVGNNHQNMQTEQLEHLPRPHSFSTFLTPNIINSNKLPIPAWYVEHVRIYEHLHKPVRIRCYPNEAIMQLRGYTDTRKTTTNNQIIIQGNWADFLSANGIENEEEFIVEIIPRSLTTSELVFNIY